MINLLLTYRSAPIILQYCTGLIGTSFVAKLEHRPRVGTFSTWRFFRVKKQTSEYDWVVLSSVFVCQPIKCFFPIFSEQVAFFLFSAHTYILTFLLGTTRKLPRLTILNHINCVGLYMNYRPLPVLTRIAVYEGPPFKTVWIDAHDFIKHLGLVCRRSVNFFGAEPNAQMSSKP